MPYSKESLPSTITNFQEKELDTLKSYAALIQKYRDCLKILLYNLARITRAHDLSKFLVYRKISKQVLKIPGDAVDIAVFK